MAKRNERVKQSHIKAVEQKTDSGIRYLAIVALVPVLLIKAYDHEAVPDYVLWVLLAVISKDMVELLRRIISK